MRVPFLLLLALGPVCGTATCRPAYAQDLGWLFAPPDRPRPNRSHAHRAAPIDVPTPVPRPPAAPGVAGEGDVRPTPSVEPPAFAANAPERADLPSAPPLPPVKPVDLAPAAPAPIPSTPVKGDASAAPAETTKPVEAPKSAEAIKPTQPPKPVEGGTRAPVAPSGATTAFDPRVPPPDAGCAARLEARGVAIEPATLPPQPDTRCTVAQPVHLLSVALADGSRASFPEKPTIACITADAFSAYVHDLLAPLARGTWGAAVTDVWTGPGLECRSRDHVFGAKLSAHGQGLAVDVAQLKLADGRFIAVGEPKTDHERDFETAARAGGCGYFHTVLGPGSDSYHRTHWHLDLEVRGRDGDGKYCK